jgi:hypothetical protein
MVQPIEAILREKKCLEISHPSLKHLSESEIVDTLLAPINPLKENMSQTIFELGCGLGRITTSPLNHPS